ncbi:hypothetical protein GCM10022198_18440 [Klugiella xanthotipulae]|uniref:Uncharacterized protein DUF3515 n=1 Tax=Klugiella xanthotipulae TaxID=244735 RepID=A0A543HRS1_9MICO|nr:uncharacterized protein DUF3515 [Klugiella xanthotipulae]
MNANDPVCANLIVRLPDVVADQPQRETNAQSTSAWGEPASVLLYCGIESSGPTELPCTNLNGVDWIVDDSRAPLYRFEAYGREPGLEVIIDNEAETPVSSTTVLIDLEQAVKELPQKRHCTATDDLTIGEDTGT